MPPSLTCCRTSWRSQRRVLVAHFAPIDVGIVLPVIPITLPPDSLQAR